MLQLGQGVAVLVQGQLEAHYAVVVEGGRVYFQLEAVAVRAVRQLAADHERACSGLQGRNMRTLRVACQEATQLSQAHTIGEIVVRASHQQIPQSFAFYGQTLTGVICDQRGQQNQPLSS